jgi:twinkle protein
MSDSTKRFLRHEPCPKCGSRDNRAVFYNDRLKGETWFCYTCNEGYYDVNLAKDKGIDYDPNTEDKPPLVLGSFVIPDLEIQGIASRLIPQRICERYGVGTDAHGNLTFPYHKTGYGCIAAKIKHAKKDQRPPSWIGNAKHVTFFGVQYKPSDQNLIITEGEEDALATMTMLSDRNHSDYTVWSIPHGAQSAKSYVKECLFDLERFKRVYLCFDNDLEGQKAAAACMNLLKPGVGYHVDLPRLQVSETVTKDACDFLLHRREAEFRLAIQSATCRRPASISDKEELRKNVHRRYFSSEYRTGLPTGILSLDDALGGWRMGECSLILAGIHQGKSTFARWLVVKQLLNGIHCLYMPLEDGNDIGVIKIIEMMQEILLISSSKVPLISAETLDQYFDSAMQHLEVTSITGSMPTDQIAEVVEYAARSKDVKFVVLDHLTIAASSGSRNDMFHTIGMTFKKLYELSRDLGIHIVVISHGTKDEEGSWKGWGNQNTNQLASNIIELSREEDKSSEIEKAILKISKNRTQRDTGTISLVFDWYKQKYNEVVGDGSRKTEGEIRASDISTLSESQQIAGKVEDVRCLDEDQLHTRLRVTERFISGTEGVPPTNQNLVKDVGVRSPTKSRPKKKIENLVRKGLSDTQDKTSNDEREVAEDGCDRRDRLRDSV